MSREPEREPVAYPVSRWLEIARGLHKHGDGTPAKAIYRATRERRLTGTATIKFTAAERERIAEIEGEQR